VSRPVHDPSRRATRIRIASYNTRDFLDDRRAAARVVRRIAPDILCLQEVPRRLFGTMRVRRFASECGLSAAGTHRGSGGTTILTGPRVRTVDVRHRRLSVAVLSRTRGYALARCEIADGASVLVASVHLSLVAGERRAHTLEVLRAVHAAGGTEGRTILAGDLNELESGSAWQLIASGMRLVSPREATYPAHRPRALLDVIFASPDLESLPHGDVDLGEADVLAASDHRPVWADVLL
jgi:endonuclease/exonuclease/phosphatase family metal-dependent hydrolase